MKFSTKLFALVLSIVMILGVFSLTSCNADNPAKDNEKIKIGLTGPLTGGASIYGIAVKNAAKLAVDEINAAGGLDGIKFDFVMLDDKHDATTVENLYAELYEGGMQVSLGTVTTAPGLNYKSFANEDNVFFLTPSATGDAIPEFANGYQMCFADSNQGTAAAEFFNENYQGKKVGVFYKTDDEYSVGIYNNFKKALDASFGDISTTTASFNGDASTFDSQIQILKDCEVVFMPMLYCSTFPVVSEVSVASGIEASGASTTTSASCTSGSSVSEVTLHTELIWSLRLPRLMSRTPCVARPWIRTSATFRRITTPDLLIIIKSLSSVTVLIATSLPVFSVMSSVFTPLPPRLVMRYSSTSLRLP